MKLPFADILHEISSVLAGEVTSLKQVNRRKSSPPIDKPRGKSQAPAQIVPVPANRHAEVTHHEPTFATEA
jgi:hypothetical protein